MPGGAHDHGRPLCLVEEGVSKDEIIKRITLAPAHLWNVKKSETLQKKEQDVE